MATLLCHIHIVPGKEGEFEAVMREMYRQTHAKEPDCLRYEYFRAAQQSKYYCLLSFTDRFAFLQHQVSDHHEGQDFASLIQSLEMEWIDPVARASPLPPTDNQLLPENPGEAITRAAEVFATRVQAWWLDHRPQ